MRPCSNRVRRPLFLAALSLSLALGGGPAATAQTQSDKAPEPQKPLTVDRDPVVSPDPGDNLPGYAGPQPTTTAGAAASSSALAKGDHGYVLHRDVEEVVLNVTVLDDKNKLVMTLDKPDFKVFEDGAPQTIIAFQHDDLPVSMGILVDNSGSMRDKREAVNSAALDLVKASNRDDEAFIVNFSDEAYIDQDFTSDIGKLRDGLAHIDSKGGTALYDAVVASADQLAKGAKRSKQVLLVITDGEDNASVMSLEQTIQRIQALQGPVVYSIGLLFKDEGGGREARRAKRALELLSSETGGVAFFPKTLGDVDEIAAEVARDIRSQYTIGYHSTKAESLGGYRIVKVEAHAPGYGKLIVRTRSGYYPRSKTAPIPKGSQADARAHGSP